MTKVGRQVESVGCNAISLHAGASAKKTCNGRQIASIHLRVHTKDEAKLDAGKKVPVIYKR